MRPLRDVLKGADGSWPPNPLVTEDAGSVKLASIGGELPIAEIYRGTHLA